MSGSVSLPGVTVRCSDADRERIGARLRDAAADGCLTMDELEDRLGGVYAARHRHELDALVTDLPATTGRRAAGWLAVLAAAWAQLRLDLMLLAGRASAGRSRRRVVVAAIAVLALVAALGSAIDGFGDLGPDLEGADDD